MNFLTPSVKPTIQPSNCLLHLGQGATYVETDGSYTLADVPPGQYGVVFMFTNQNLSSRRLELDVDPVQVGGISEGDIKTDLERE